MKHELPAPLPLQPSVTSIPHSFSVNLTTLGIHPILVLFYTSFKKAWELRYSLRAISEQASLVVIGLRAREMLCVLVGCPGATSAEGMLVWWAFAAVVPPPWLSPGGSCLDAVAESVVSLVFPCSDVWPKADGILILFFKVPTHGKVV